MSWETSVDQDRRGFWLVVSVDISEDRRGPYLSRDEAKAEELKARLDLSRRLGPAFSQD